MSAQIFCAKIWYLGSSRISWSLSFLMSLLEKEPLEVSWYDIFRPLDLGSLFSLYEALPDRYAHLRDLLSCRIQEEIYNAIMEANKEMKVLGRKAACFETHLPDIREKILGYR